MFRTRERFVTVVSSSAVLLLLFGQSLTEASTPNAYLTVTGTDKRWPVKRGDFGTDSDRVKGELVHSPPSDNFLCNYFDEEFDPFQDESSNQTTYVAPTRENTFADVSGNLIMMVPRGHCTWERKAFAARELFGAVGIIIYDNLAARYRIDRETGEVIFPKKKQDYECKNGIGTMEDLDLDPPEYDPNKLDKLLDMTSSTSRCELTGRNQCESQLCVVTSHKANATNYPVCCAWDTLITMPKDTSWKKGEPGSAGDIFPVFITIRQGQEFLGMMSRQSTPLHVSVKMRPYKVFNVSMVFLYFLGVGVCALACWYSASYYRYFKAKLDRLKERHPGATGMTNVNFDDDEEETDPDIFNDEEAANSEGDSDNRLPPPPRSKREKQKSMKKKADKKGKKQQSEKLYSLPPPERRRGRFCWWGGNDNDNNDNDEAPTNGEDGTTTNGDNEAPPGDQECLSGYEKSIAELEKKKKEDPTYMVLYSLPPPERRPSQRERGPSSPSNRGPKSRRGSFQGNNQKPPPRMWTAEPKNIELGMYHVVGFVVAASVMLLVLFFFKMYTAVTVIYAIGCAGCVSHLIFGPLLVRLVPHLGQGWVDELNKKVMCNLNGFDVASQLAGFFWAGLWLWYGFTHYKPVRNFFFFMTLNIFGACFCILLLSMIKLYSIKIATALMIAIFFYDIFFVFITPLLTGGDSIMIAVAQGGKSGSIYADDMCYKYANDKDCAGMDFLPMLLSFPRINDYMKGSTFLGLGDIVLPGFLIAFGARVDAAKRLLADHSTAIVRDVPRKFYEGYFFPLMIAYAVGLFFAYLAVSLMERGQPALLYLVPCVLGTMLVIGRKDLRELWNESKDLRNADKFAAKWEKTWSREKMMREIEKHKHDKRRKSLPKRGLMDVLEGGGGSGSAPAISSGSPQRGRSPGRHPEGSQGEQNPAPRGGKSPSKGGPSKGGPSKGGPSKGGPSKGGPSKGGPSTGGPSTGGPSKGGPSKGGPSKGGASRGGASKGSASKGSASKRGPGKEGRVRGGSVGNTSDGRGRPAPGSKTPRGRSPPKIQPKPR